MVNHYASNCPKPRKKRSSQAARCNCEGCIAAGKGLRSDGEDMEDLGPRRMRVKGTWTPEPKTRRSREQEAPQEHRRNRSHGTPTEAYIQEEIREENRSQMTAERKEQRRSGSTRSWQG